MEKHFCTYKPKEEVDFFLLIKDFFFSAVDWIYLHPITTFIISVELFSLYFMMTFLLYRMILKLSVMLDETLERCSYDKEYRNSIASVIFFFSDMGPSISSFSVIAIFITTGENIIVLTVVFFLGIIVKEGSRKLKNKFYFEINKRCSS